MTTDSPLISLGFPYKLIENNPVATVNPIESTDGHNRDPDIQVNVSIMNQHTIFYRQN